MHTLTCVSGYWKIPNKHNTDDFLKWFETTLQVNCPYVFFGTKETIELVSTYRRELPTQYIEFELEDFYSYKYKDKMKTHVRHCPSVELNIIWNEKIFFLEKAKDLNLFNTEFFAWIDAGICSLRDKVPSLDLFPNSNKLSLLPKNKFIFTSSDGSVYEPTKLGFEYHFISGTLYILHKSIIDLIATLYRLYMDKYIEPTRVYTDQILLTYIYNDFPNLFHQIGHGYGEGINILSTSYEKNTVLFITAFKNLQRESWINFERSVEEYIQWFKNLSSIPIRLICFCDKEIETILHNECGFYNTYLYNEHDTFLRFIDKEKEIMESEEFRVLINNRNDPEVNKPGYNCVNHNKVWFLKKAKEMFPTYSHYAWIDFGCIRTQEFPEQLDFTNLGNKITYASKNYFTVDQILTPLEAVKNGPTNNPDLFGSEFFCPNELVEWYYNEYYKLVLSYYSNNLVDDDQEMVKQLLKKYTDKFEIIVTHRWFSLLNNYRVPLTIDVVIPTCLKDIDTLNLVIKGVKKNISMLGTIYIVCHPNLKHKLTEGIFVDETHYPFSIQDVAEEIFGNRDHPGNHERAQGWWYQQLLKLYSYKVIKNISSNILIVDSETVFYNKYIPIKDNIAYYAVSNEINNQYRNHMKLLLPDISIYKNTISGICHQMLFQKHVLQNLFDRVEYYHKTSIHVPFWRLMLKVAKQNSRLEYSEYDLYFNFMLTFHRPMVRLTNDISWDISPNVPESCEKTYLTAHFHLRNRNVQANTFYVEV
jgi:hypothetical protein